MPRKTLSTLNMAIQLVLLALAFAVYYIFKSRWNPVGFDAFSYWNLAADGDFVSTLIKVSLIPVVFATIFGILDLVRTPYEMHTSYLFKMFRSGFAGIVEEISHRSVFIYIAMIVVAFLNSAFIWVVAIVMLLLAIGFIFVFEKVWAYIVGIVVAIAGFLLVRSWIGFGPIYSLYEKIIIPAYSWLMSNEHPMNSVIVIGVFVGFQIALGVFFRKLTIAITGEEQWEGRNILYGILQTLVLGVYWFFMFRAVDPSVVVAGPIILSSAIITSAKWFKDGHKYQGVMGETNSWVLAFYAQYVAFTYGLVFAIILHALYNMVLATGGHIIHALRNRKKV